MAKYRDRKRTNVTWVSFSLLFSDASRWFVSKADLSGVISLGAVVSSRIWLCLFWFDRLMSLGTGRPILLRDDESVAHARFLLFVAPLFALFLRLVHMLIFTSITSSSVLIG